MTWVYSQSTGELRRDGILIGVGYSGHGDGLNDPADQQVRNVGPIPQGMYTIGPAFTHPAAGPVTMRLTPGPKTETFGRDGFLIHGDSASQDHSASRGCIIMPRVVRAAVSASKDTALKVTA